MKKWICPSAVELHVMFTQGGSTNGQESVKVDGVKGNKHLTPTPTPIIEPTIPGTGPSQS